MISGTVHYLKAMRALYFSKKRKKHWLPQESTSKVWEQHWLEVRSGFSICIAWGVGMLKWENLPRTNSTKYETQNILVKFQQNEHTPEISNITSMLDFRKKS